MTNTPILFLIFNRPELASKVFESIREARPKKLYIASDGPRNNKPNEEQKVRKTRRKILSMVDWNCDVKTLFRDENLGCKNAVSGAITWFFENEEQGIILEDDCLPSPSFFPFCEELLEKYKYDGDVFAISGYPGDADSLIVHNDYAFSKYPRVWGWATWADVWSEYDPDLKDWKDNKRRLTAKLSSHKPTQKFWAAIFDKMAKQRIDTWDYQLTYLFLKKGGKCALSRTNLVSNIGFGEDATHTQNINSEDANRPAFDLTFPIKHSPRKQEEETINKHYERTIFFKDKFLNRLLKFLKTF